MIYHDCECCGQFNILGTLFKHDRYCNDCLEKEEKKMPIFKCVCGGEIRAVEPYNPTKCVLNCSNCGALYVPRTLICKDNRPLINRPNIGSIVEGA